MNNPLVRGYHRRRMRAGRKTLAILTALGAGSTLGVILLGGVFGALGGAAGYTALYAEATSYLSDNPATCVNCHIMNEQYESWHSSSHATRATCNDCHVPHTSLLAKYLVKAEHGYRHSKLFTLQTFHEPIQIAPLSRKVVIQNCIRCHEEMTSEIRLAIHDQQQGIDSELHEVDCVRCHSAVAHGPTR